LWIFCALSSSALGQTLSFIEATGEPTLKLVEDGTARVRVTGPAANADPNLAETVTVHLQTLYSQDQEDLTLTETGLDTGVFEGSIHLNYASLGTPFNGMLDTANSGSPPIQLDEVTATFGNASTQAHMVGSRVWFIDRFGRVATSFPVGGTIGVRVEKPAVGNPESWDQIYNFQINVQEGNLSHTYYLNLNETGPDTGVFEGTIPSSAVFSGFNVVQGAPGLTMQAISQGAFSYDPAMASAVFTGSQVLFVDAQGQPASVYLEGTRAYLRVEDHQAAGSRNVQVTDELLGDQETVMLQETGAGSGIFQGSIGLRYYDQGPLPGNGVLETGESAGPPFQYETLHATYTDSAGGASSATASTLGYRIWFLDAYGNVVGTYPQGTRAYVRIEWHNFVDPNVFDSLTVRMQSASGDSEYLQVIETGRDTGIFEGSIPLDSSGAVSGGDGRLQAVPGDLIGADRNGITPPMPVYARIDSASVQLIDDAGRPTAEVLQFGTARVRVVSPADNHSSAAVEMVVAQVSCRYKLDAEAVTLTETGPDTGVFEGSIHLVYTQSNAIPGNGILETQDSGDVPARKPEEVKAAYGAYSATARVIGSRVVFIDDFGRETSTFPVGANVGVRLTEPGSNNPGSFDTIYSVGIGVQYDAGQNSTGTSYYNLDLNETGVDTGVFEGRLPSSSNSSSQSVILAAPGRLLKMEHWNPYSPLIATAQAAFTGGRVLFVDAQGQPASVYLEGTRAYLRVEDHLAAGPRSVQLTDEISGDQETVTLQETSAGSGIFLGSIGLQYYDQGPLPGNGVLETGESVGPPFQYETLHAIYADSAGGASSATATTLGYRVWFLDAYGNVVGTYPQGTRAYVRIEWHNFIDPNVFDILAARLQSAGGDLEFLQLTETGRDSGVFEGSIALDSSGAVSSGDGRLQAVPGNWIGADRNGITPPMPVVAWIDGSGVQFIDAAGRPTAEVLQFDAGRVRVVSPGDNHSSTAVETVTVQLSSRYKLDAEAVTLTETGPDTGIFEGSIPLAYTQGNATLGNGVLETQDSGDVPPRKPEEVKATYGAYSATARVIGSRVVFIDDFGRETSTFPVGANVGVRLTEPASNNPGSFDTIYNVGIGVQYVAGQNSTGTSYYNLNLNETGVDTGVFEGRLPSSSSSSSQSVILAAPGRLLKVEHWNPYSPLIATAQAAFTGSQVLFVDAQGQPASVYLEGTRAYLRVEDHQAAGSRNVLVTDEISGDQETVSLQETGTGSGIFQGSIGLRYYDQSPLPGNGVLETGESAGPPFQYETLHATYADSAGGASSATATTLGYRVWFLDAYGNAVDSYPQGSRAYVRIEWHNFVDPNAIDSLSARLQSGSGDSEYLQVIETGRDTGIFEGSIALDSSGAVSSGDGRLQAVPGNWIGADRNGTTPPMPAYAWIDSASIQIIDDAGRPADKVLQFSTARVRVVSPADNHNSTAVEAVTVQVSSRYKLDAETLTLTETGPDTGVFEGSIPLVYTQNNAIPGNGVLETQDSGDVPPRKPEEVTATYGAYSATAQVIGSRVVFIDDFGRETSTFPVGANVGVRLTEPASNNPGSFDTIYNVGIGATYDAGPNSTGTTFRYLNLSETGVDTGVFEGRLPSSPNSSSQTVIPAAPGRILTVEHWNPYSPLIATAHATFTGAQVLFVDAQGQPASVYLEGTRAYLRVEDHQSAGPHNVLVTTELSGDQETVTLQETSAGSGIFLGSIELGLSNSALPGNSRLETGESFGPPFQYETIHASYTGSASTSTAIATTLGYRVWFLDAAGTVVNSYLQGSRAYVRLEDHNYNDPNFINTLYVHLGSSSGDEEFLQVTETGVATGIYEGSIPLDLGAVAVGDGRLQAPAGGEIAADRHGAWFPAPVYAGIDAAAVEFIDEAGVTTVELLENGMARVRVSSRQDNLNPAAADSIGIVLRSRYGNDQENPTLTETGPDTGIFEGSFRLLFNATPASGNGTLETRLSPGYQPDEVTATYGAYSVTAHDVLQKPAFLDLRGQVTSSYPLRSRINVRVLDSIGNNPSQIDSFTVTLQSLGNDTETLWVTETGPDTGVFLGSISSTEQSGSSYDSVLSAAAGQVLQVQTTSPYGPSPAAQATMTAFLAPQVQDDSAEVAEGAQVTIDVLANDGGGSLSVAEYTQPQHGSVIFDSQGVATYTSTVGYNGPDYFTYLVVDPQGSQAMAYVALTITPANRPPVAGDDVAAMNEDGSIDLEVLANDSDPESDTLSVESVTQPSHGTATINPDKTVRYVPAPNFNGTDSFTYVVGEGHFTAMATVSIIVRPINDAPVANADSATVAEDGTVDVPVLGNDTDAEGDTLTVAAVTQGTHGVAAINPDKSVKYTPAANYRGSDSFTYTVSDGNGGTATGAVTITVTAVNDAPVANADSSTVAEDGTVNVAVLGNDTDPDGDTLSVASVTQGTHGAVVINPDKSVKYTPAANYNGSDSFTYTVSDSNGGTATGTVTVTITAVNDAPVANADAATVAEDGTVNVAVVGNDTDPDGDTLSVASVTQGAHGAVVINPDKTVKYTPAANYNGSDSFTYTASDGNGGTATGTVTVTVTAVNDSPVANADTATVAEDGTVNVTVLGNDTDPDGDTLSVTSVTQGTHGAVVINPDKTVKYTPAANYNGSDSFTYTVSDGNGGSATGTVTMTITAVNDSPMANADVATVAEDGTVNMTVLGNDTDPDGDTLSVASVTQGTHGAVAINPDKTVKYTPAANYNGSDAFTYTVSDGNGGTATGTVTMTITAVNDAPVANADAATVAEDGTVNVAVLGNDTDPDGDTLSVASVTQGTHGAVVINPDKTVKYTPAANYNGSDSFTYTVSDSNGGTATGAVTITVTGVNDAPVANADAATVAEDGTVNVTVLGNDTDPDGDTLSVASVTQGTHGAAVINPDKTVKYTPSANYNGSDSFTYTVSDGNGGTATGTVTITVTGVNDAPVANADAATVAEDGTVNVAVLGNDTDPDGDTLSVASVTQETHGAVTINSDKTVKYTPAANYNGSDSFTYTVSDGNGGTATGTVTMTITAVNDAPVANADAATVAEDGTVNVAVLGNDTDPDGDTLSVASVTQGIHGAVVINPDKTVKYTPAANYNGSDSFSYTVSDGNGGTATGTVTITVTGVNDAPVANADSATVAEDGTVNVTVLGNDTDPDGDTLSVASVTQGAHGAVVINPDKTAKYTPTANYNGSDSFTYTASDGNGGSATGTVTMTITAANDAPVANADSATVAEDGTINVSVLANDTDPDGDVLSVASVTQGAHGAVVINPDKTVKYTPAANYNGSDSFTYTVSDGHGGTATAAVGINVTPVNDPPVAVNDAATVVAGSAATVSVLTNDADIDGPSLSVATVTQGAHGSVVINAGQTVTYTAALYVGTDTFTYTVSDGAGGTATATVNVTITAPARISTGIQARYNFNEGSGSTVNDSSGVGTPLNLTISSPSSVSWISGGLKVNTATAISSSSLASKIISAAQTSNAFTVEAWVTPTSLTLTGPARIATIMKNASQRNLVFGQSANRYETQFKTSTGTPSVQSPTGSLTQALTHVVYTQSSSGQAVFYINGVQVSTQTTTGNLSTWGTDQKLTLADNWQGSYFLLAVYGRALTGPEVQQNYLAGSNAN